MAGYARTIQLIDFALDFEVDARGLSAPVPAASRLFFDPEEGARVAVPLLRAFLHHAFELAGRSRPAHRRWRVELAQAMTRSFYWPEVLAADAAILLSSVMFEVELRERRLERLSFDELRNVFGRYVRFGIDWFLEYGAEPFIWDLSMGNVLLFTHAAEGEKGRWLVDLDRPVKRTAAEFRKLIDR
jgi:hypothetical protein